MADFNAPFLNGFSTNISASDKAAVTRIIRRAAEEIRQYAHNRYDYSEMPGISLTMTACMLDWEVKQWAARTRTDDDAPKKGLRVIKGGRSPRG